MVKMVIREGTHGHFWGCSLYPSCTATAQLTPREKAHMAS
jgi:ssDNA-binding Zn-finger/Zn-ribbon topoisomerase 1